ncbi:hypothetical protein [Pseudomonas sp. SWI44]|uniref:hypothetical protein n=1 Tax=Pseudomonas sp. SWI44 TaxID=2083053 RepID=UPI00131A1619|nr:hypothetical protein [Pseudomonas sp. SWI44]
MDRPYHERDWIGVVMHVSHAEYQQISQSWSFELPNDRQPSIVSLLACQYVGFVVDGSWHAVAEINFWKFGVGDGGQKIADLSAISERTYNLSMTLKNGISQTLWLTEFQRQALQADLSTSCHYRPVEIAPALTMEEACASVARRYGVSAEQVNVAIHSKALAPAS